MRTLKTVDTLALYVYTYPYFVFYYFYTWYLMSTLSDDKSFSQANAPVQLEQQDTSCLSCLGTNCRYKHKDVYTAFYLMCTKGEWRFVTTAVHFESLLTRNKEKNIFPTTCGIPSTSLCTCFFLSLSPTLPCDCYDFFPFSQRKKKHRKDASLDLSPSWGLCYDYSRAPKCL